MAPKRATRNVPLMLVAVIVSLTSSAPQTTVIVTAVTWRAAHSPLDANPTPAGGLRIYPGKQAPRDAVDRRSVWVDAEVHPPRAGVTVFFRAFDVDDPSSDSAPVDGNGSAGNDNRGLPRSGRLRAGSAVTDARGIATVEFAVTRQPGDNFRVAASIHPGPLEGVAEIGDRIEATEPLTVWRRLHLEVDSMGKVVGNESEDDDRIVEDVPMPDTSLLEATLAPAFVTPAFDVGDNNDEVPFVLNLDPAALVSAYDFDSFTSHASSAFWTVYILGAYQGSENKDGDPDGEARLYGLVDPRPSFDSDDRMGAVIFMETLQELAPDVHRAAATAVVHEVGHLFGSEHGDGGVMNTPLSDLVAAGVIDYSPVTLNKIRSRTHP